MKFFSFTRTGLPLLVAHRILMGCLTGCLMLCLMNCKGKTDLPEEEAEAVRTDSATMDSTATDSIAEMEMEVPPKKADELFDDFVFAFMKNQYFQKQRIDFPLSYTVDDKTTRIRRKDWTFDRMYSMEEIYTLIFDSAKGEEKAKDTTLRSVIVEEINIETFRTKTYKFKRREGEWRLVAISEQNLDDSENSEFYSFYHQFASDPDFQLRHIASPLTFSTYDTDCFEVVDGVISPEQFKDFAPELPTTKITNILYGQTFKNSRLRILSIRALSGGMESNMQFEKNDENEWMLTRLDN